MKLMNKHEYWGKEDVKPFMADVDRDGLVISPEVLYKKHRKVEPLELPEGYEWVSIDMKNSDELDKVFELLKDNFVEDNRALLRFQYTKEIIEWVTVTTQYN